MHEEGEEERKEKKEKKISLFENEELTCNAMLFFKGAKIVHYQVIRTTFVS